MTPCDAPFPFCIANRRDSLRLFIWIALTAFSQGWIVRRMEPISRRALRPPGSCYFMIKRQSNFNDKNSALKRNGSSVKNKSPNSGKSNRHHKSDNVGSASQQPAAVPRSPATAFASSSPSNNKSRSPPWQVLSAKDAKENVEKEKQRRMLEKQGNHTALTLSSSSNSGAISGSVSMEFLSDTDRRLIKWKPFNPSTVPKGMKFIGGYLDKRLPPHFGVPEIAFLGRSNVGKSSLLNRLAAMSSSSSSSSSTKSSPSTKSSSSSSFSSASTTSNDQARVGKTPGATASVNLYTMLGSRGGINNKPPKPILGLVDLPGFGYAKLSQQVQAAVQIAAERYLEKRKELALGILLVDARRDTPSDDDRAVLAALYDMGIPIAVVATKVDKLSARELPGCLRGIRQGLGLPEGQPLCVSSVTGQGTKELWRIILEACETKVKELRQQYERNSNGNNENEEEMEGESSIGDLDDEDVVYDQGYDWINDDTSSVDDDEGDDFGDDGNGFEDDDDEMRYDAKNGIQATNDSPVRESLQSLRKRARDMKRKGEL